MSDGKFLKRYFYLYALSIECEMSLAEFTLGILQINPKTWDFYVAREYIKQLTEQLELTEHERKILKFMELRANEDNKGDKL